MSPVKRMKIQAILFVLLFFMSCSVIPAQPKPAIVSQANLGKKITVEGRAVDRKMGAQLIGEDFDLWIDGLSGWPSGYYTGGEKGRKVRVSGILAEDHGLPVFIPRKNEPVMQGIPVPEGTDLKKAAHRYILREATWELLEK